MLHLSWKSQTFCWTFRKLRSWSCLFLCTCYFNWLKFLAPAKRASANSFASLLSSCSGLSVVRLVPVESLLSQLWHGQADLHQKNTAAKPVWWGPLWGYRSSHQDMHCIWVWWVWSSVISHHKLFSSQRKPGAFLSFTWLIWHFLKQFILALSYCLCYHNRIYLLQEKKS